MNKKNDDATAKVCWFLLTGEVRLLPTTWCYYIDPFCPERNQTNLSTFGFTSLRITSMNMNSLTSSQELNCKCLIYMFLQNAQVGANSLLKLLLNISLLQFPIFMFCLFECCETSFLVQINASLMTMTIVTPNSGKCLRVA